MEPAPPVQDPPPGDSLTQRLRDSRRTRLNEKILQEKAVEQKTAQEQASVRAKQAQNSIYSGLDQAGSFFAFVCGRSNHQKLPISPKPKQQQE